MTIKNLIVEKITDRAVQVYNTEFEAVKDTIEHADEVAVEETTTEILAQLATLRSLGTAVDRLGMLEVFSER